MEYIVWLELKTELVILSVSDRWQWTKRPKNTKMVILSQRYKWTYPIWHFPMGQHSPTFLGFNVHQTCPSEQGVSKRGLWAAASIKSWPSIRMRQMKTIFIFKFKSWSERYHKMNVVSSFIGNTNNCCVHHKVWYLKRRPISKPVFWIRNLEF